MPSKREEERNEKIIRGLTKLPPNRTCMNCNARGPQYVCTNFWTFVCATCSGIHREFTHRVKSISMAKFSEQEVKALENGGNQHARDTFLKDWDTQRMKFPNSSDADKIREFIRNVYVYKKYAEERSFSKPSRDMKGCNNHEHRNRANTCHSCSQSPFYEHQHGSGQIDRSQVNMLIGWPDLNQEYYGRTASGSIYSSQRLENNMNDDKFGNENSSSIFSDYSGSTIGDLFRYDSQSSNFQDSACNSPNLLKARDLLTENEQPQMSDRYSEANIRMNCNKCPYIKSTISSGNSESDAGSSKSFRSVSESFRTASESFRSTSLDSLIDDAIENKEIAETQDELAITLLSQSSNPGHINNQDFVNVPPFPPTIPLTLSGGSWATFDTQEPFDIFESNKEVISMGQLDITVPKVTENVQVSTHYSQLLSLNNSVAFEPFKSSNQLELDLQQWHNFEDSIGDTPYTLLGSLPQNDQLHVPMYTSPTCIDPYIGHKILQDDMVRVQKSINPFDIPSEDDSEVFVMKAFQTTIPFPEVSKIDESYQQWLSQNSFLQGGSAYMESYNTSYILSSPLPQGSATSRQGNPFI